MKSKQKAEGERLSALCFWGKALPGRIPRRKAWPTAVPTGLFDLPKSTADVTRPWEDDPVGFAVVGLGMGHIRSKEITQTPGTRLVEVCRVLC
jgi:hypothetical protein